LSTNFHKIIGGLLEEGKKDAIIPKLTCKGIFFSPSMFQYKKLGHFFPKKRGAKVF